MNAVQLAEQQLAEAKAREQRWREEAARQEEAVEGRREERRARAEHEARKPERWRALPALERALFVAAAEDPRSIRAALVRVAQLVASPGGIPMVTPPSTFEPPAQ